MNQDKYDGLARPNHKDCQLKLLDLGPNWRDHWWGMPEFTMGDATPQYKITVNFMTWEDVVEFAQKLGVRVTPRSDSLWFPEQNLDEPKEWAYVED